MGPSLSGFLQEAVADLLSSTPKGSFNRISLMAYSVASRLYFPRWERSFSRVSLMAYSVASRLYLPRWEHILWIDDLDVVDAGGREARCLVG